MNLAVIGVGNLTSDVVAKTFGDRKVLEFSIATNEQRKNREGNYEAYASFVNCRHWVKANSTLDQFLLKGVQVQINGTMLQERWEKEGKKDSKIVVEVNDLRLLGAKKEGETATTATPASSAKPESATSAQSAPKKEAPSIEIDEDEIPF